MPKALYISDDTLLMSWSYLSDRKILEIVNDPKRDQDMDLIRTRLLVLRGIPVPSHLKQYVK